MSGYYNQPDPDEGQDTAGGGLRKMLEQVLEENKSLRKLIEGDKRQDVVTETVKGMGLDPAIAELIPADETDPKKWLEDRAHLFGVKKAESDEGQPGTEPEVRVAPDDDPAVVAERQALEAMQGAAAAGSPSATVSNDLLQGLEKCQTEDELMAYLRRNGMA